MWVWRLCLRFYILKSAFSILRTFQYVGVDDSLKKRFSSSKKLFFKHKLSDLAYFENSYSSNEKALFTCKSPRDVPVKFGSDTSHVGSVFHSSECVKTSSQKKRLLCNEKISIFFPLFVKNMNFEERKALFCKWLYILGYTCSIRIMHVFSSPSIYFGVFLIDFKLFWLALTDP